LFLQWPLTSNSHIRNGLAENFFEKQGFFCKSPMAVAPMKWMGAAQLSVVVSRARRRMQKNHGHKFRGLFQQTK
jgi:hypothetical protein